MKARQRKKRTSIKKDALRLLADPQFLFNAGQKIGELGVVGEERNRLILLLAGIARVLPEPPSVLVKGPTGSGKSTLVKDSVKLFPPDCIVERAGLSGKALAYGSGALTSKILLINEYRCGKDAQLLLRLLQSEGRIRHESTAIRGSHRATRTVERIGTPVVLTTTTDNKVFADDETRFLSIWVDESPSQTLAILTAQSSNPIRANEKDLSVWRKVMSLLTCHEMDFQNPPAWLRYVVGRLPLGKVRVRRDWNRFLSFCKAVALCGRPSTPTRDALNVTFADYCVAYRILEPVLASTVHGLPTLELAVSQVVASLNKQLGRAVTTHEVARVLGWKDALVYKHVKRAAQDKLIDYEPGTREKNVKRLLSRADSIGGFLPSPISVFKNNPEIGSEVRYVDPFTGVKKVMRRAKRRRG